MSLLEVTPPKDRLWADPFPLRADDGRACLFAEEPRHSDGKGRIVAMEIDPKMGAGKPFPVLERPYHLSYPHVFRWQDRYHVVPESSANRTVTLFRCVSFPDCRFEEKDLLRDIEAVDATLEEVGGRWWMFVNVGTPGAGNRDELHLYHAETDLITADDYRETHVAEIVPSWDRKARRARTLNHRDGIVVIDLLRHRRRFP